jgi:hypothetical protein
MAIHWHLPGGYKGEQPKLRINIIMNWSSGSCISKTCSIVYTFFRLIEVPPLATTLKGVYFIYILLPLHVSVPVGHLQADTQLFQEDTLPTTDPCFVLLGPIFICLENSVVVCLMCVFELSKRGQITSLLNVRIFKMLTWSNIKMLPFTYLLRGLSPQANYTERATAACRRS